MTLQVELCPYGEPALAKLRDLVDRAKGDDPLFPVTVVVERGTVGLGVRRALASEVSPSGRRGVANVAFLTLGALADALAGSALAEQGRAPLVDAVLRAALRGALSEASGALLGPARDHPSTIDALVVTYRELRSVDEDVLQRLAGASERAAEVVEVIRSARQRLSDWYDEIDVCHEAAARCAESTSLPELGLVVLYLPSALTGPAARLVRNLAAHVPCAAVIGVTGDPLADGLAHQMVASLHPENEPTWPVDAEVPVAGEVLSAPAADTELLLVLRDLMARCERGTSPERMAIVHAGTPQYMTLIHNMLAEAGIPFNGSGVRPLSATVPGRMLLGALQLTEHDWRRDDVTAWLATGPFMHRGRSIPAGRWDVLSAEAGVIGGLDDWHRQLGARARALRAAAAEGQETGDDDDAPWRAAREADADRCEDLLGFLDTMAERLERTPSTWGAWAEWAVTLLHDLIGGPGALDGWPLAEVAAKEGVEEAIGRLAVLEKLGSPVSPTLARAELVAELGAPAPQTTRFGSGVWVAPVGAAVGLSLSVLYVVGMNDGSFPRRPSDDVLIPDHEREMAPADGLLPLRGGRAVAMRRDYLAALAGARTRILSFPRGNQRDGRDLRPSRWLLDSLGALSGRVGRLYSSDMGSVQQSDRYRVTPSYIGAVAAPGAPVDLGDRDLRSLLRWTEPGRPLGEHWLTEEIPQLARSVEFSGHSGRGFTRFDGDLGPLATATALLPRLLSASRLETFASCPRRYFFESVLEVIPRPESELLLAADRGRRGTLVHTILERFVQAQINQQPESDGWAFSTARLLAIAEEEMAAFEAEGAAGPAASWRFEQARIRRELRQVVAIDRRWRRVHGARAIGVEQPFGHGGVEPVPVARPGRTPVWFRGTIDRIDVASDGRHIVTDYKTGRMDRYARVEEDHFLGGRSLQLALYGLAVTSGAPSVHVRYWFVSERGRFLDRGFDFSEADRRALEQMVGIYTDTMQRGHFPAHPGPEQCGYCPYASVCPVDRQTVWERVRRAPELSPYVELVEPAAPVGS